jgi:hypothetical protein
MRLWCILNHLFKKEVSNLKFWKQQKYVWTYTIEDGTPSNSFRGGIYELKEPLIK